jgi:hypothetical protein
MRFFVDVAELRPARTGNARLGALGVVLVALLGAVGWYWSRPSTQPDFDEGRAVADAFLTAIREGRPEQAWASTTAEFKSAEGQESFLRLVRTKPFLKEPLSFVSLQEVSIQQQPRSEYLFREAQSAATVRIVIGREAADWKVDRVLFE